MSALLRHAQSKKGAIDIGERHTKLNTCSCQIKSGHETDGCKDHDNTPWWGGVLNLSGSKSGPSVVLHPSDVGV